MHAHLHTSRDPAIHLEARRTYLHTSRGLARHSNIFRYKKNMYKTNKQISWKNYICIHRYGGKAKHKIKKNSKYEETTENIYSM